MLNHVTIRLFQLEQCGEHQLKKTTHCFTFCPRFPSAPRHNETGTQRTRFSQSGPRRTNSETRRERMCSGKLQQIQSGRSRLWWDKLVGYPSSPPTALGAIWQRRARAVFFFGLARVRLVLCVCCPSKCHTGRCLKGLGNV